MGGWSTGQLLLAFHPLGLLAYYQQFWSSFILKHEASPVDLFWFPVPLVLGEENFSQFA